MKLKCLRDVVLFNFLSLSCAKEIVDKTWKCSNYCSIKWKRESQSLTWLSFNKKKYRRSFGFSRWVKYCAISYDETFEFKLYLLSENSKLRLPVALHSPQAVANRMKIRSTRIDSACHAIITEKTLLQQRVSKFSARKTFKWRWSELFVQQSTFFIHNSVNFRLLIYFLLSFL